jgi:DNA-binding response OmpR family regulator
MPKILVIDDEPNIQKLAEANLTARGFQVLVAADGEEGLKLAQLERPNLILLDLRLPGMSGWDVLMILKTDRKLQKIPVIIMTATVPQSEESKFLAMRTAGYLVKPFDINEMMRQVRLAIGK